MKLNNLKLLRNLALGLTLFSGTAVAELAMNDTGVNDLRTGRPATHTERVVQMNTTPQPEDINADSGWTPVMIKDVQRKLSDRGYNVGPADGVVGKKTRTSISEFQRSTGLPVTESINEMTLQRLGLDVNSVKNTADEIYSE